MPAHWTYADFDRDSDLEQGDILQPTDELRNILREVHPHFCNDKYLGFVLATQTCDLVRRKKSSKIRYINLAVVRPLYQVVHRLIAHVVKPAGEGKFPGSGKQDARKLFERLFNQNEQTLGLFYLHQDSDSGIGEPAVAMLRVTVTVRSEHYGVLLIARTGRLKPEFQAKFGWLLGNLYNRPASPDWADNPGGSDILKGLVAQYVEGDMELTPGLNVAWIDDILLREAKAKGIPVESATLQDLEALRPSPPLDRALDEIGNQLLRVAPEIPNETVEKLKSRLKNSGKFKKLLATAI